MDNFTDKINMNKIKNDTDEYVLDISKNFLDYMSWDDTKLNNKITVKEAMSMFCFMMANLMMTINTDFETNIACIGALGERIRNLEYNNMKNLYFTMGMMGHTSWQKSYKEYSEEFDELNKNNTVGEYASVEVETDTESKEKK